MFKDPGKKIKIASQVLFWILVVVFIVLAFTLGTYKVRNVRPPYETTAYNWPLFLGFIFGGPVFAYLSSLIMYGFGELVENSGENKGKKAKKENTVIPESAPQQ